jgi:hypothetical protein
MCAFVVALATVFVGSPAAAPARAAPPPKNPIIAWTPASLDLTVAPGGGSVEAVSFTTAKKFARVNIAATGAIAAFVTPSPDTVSPVAVDTPVLVSLSVAVPETTPLGDYTGALKVSAPKKAVADSLPVTIHVVAAEGGHIYWTNASSGVGRADLDGSNADSAFIPVSAAGNPVGLAVDDQHIYWSDPNASPPTIGRANLDGSNANPTFIPLSYVEPISGRPAQPIGLALDDQYIYWADANYPSIGRVRLDGSDLQPNFIYLPLGLPYGVAVDANHIYWVDEVWLDGSIGRADLDGSNVDSSFMVFGGRLSGGLVDVTVDDQHIYWSFNIYPADAYVGRANLDGSDADPAFITTSVYGTYGVAVDADHVYWGHGAGIGRASLDGSDPDSFFMDSGTALFVAIGR